MSDIIWVAIITAVPSTVAAILGFRNSSKIEQVHKATNSMKDELVAATKSSAFQAGQTSGRKERKTLASKPKRK
jgi:hypothetical protein